MVYVIRTPTIADADDLGRVHVTAWQAAYRGLMPDDYLDGLDAAERAEMWREALATTPDPDHRRTRLVATADGVVQGFALAGPADGDADAVRGQLYAINVDPDHWGAGAGPALIDAAVEALRAWGFPDAVLWVHPGNARARAFYEARGWRCDEVEQIDEVFGIEVPEVRYSISLAIP